MTPPAQLTAGARDLVWLLTELAVLFLLVAAGLAVAVRRLGLHRLRRLLEGGRRAGAVKGIMLGFLTPFCTYSAIPVLVTMLRLGIRPSAWVGFLLAAPVLDPLIAVAIAVIFSPAVALAYTAATFTGVLVVALLADHAGVRARAAAGDLRRPPSAPPMPGSSPRDPADDAACAPDCVTDRQAHDATCAPDPLTDRSPWRGWTAETRDALRYASGLLRGMALPLSIAAAVGVALVGVVPRDVITAVAGPDNPLAVPAAALMGTPFYVSGEAFLPIAAALRHQGMGDGAVFALIITGAGVNLPELTVLGKLLAPRLLAALVGAVFAIATVAGYVIPAVTS